MTFEAQNPEYRTFIEGVFRPQPFMMSLGTKLSRIAPGDVELSLAISADHLQHGGAAPSRFMSALILARSPGEEDIRSAIDFAHDDLAGRHQRPEQHGGCIGARQNGLRFDPPLELFI
jgi:hypothetical protein